MEFPITFFTQYDEENNYYLAHSTLTLMNGQGATEEDAIQNHINIFNKNPTTDFYELKCSGNPNITVKHYVLSEIK